MFVRVLGTYYVIFYHDKTNTRYLSSVLEPVCTCCFSANQRRRGSIFVLDTAAETLLQCRNVKEIGQFLTKLRPQ